MRYLFVFALTFAGLFWAALALTPTTYTPAGKALRKRGKQKASQMQVWCRGIADKLEPHIDFDPVRRAKIADDLVSMGYQTTPERFRADALAKGLLLSVFVVVLVPVMPLPALVIWGLTVWAVWRGEEQKLQKAMQARRTKIERELPKLAAVIRQNLDFTNDVVEILGRYQELCSTQLAGEIQRTINEAQMGSPEAALKGMEARIASARLSELTRGLIGVIRGDDQRFYFDMLTAELQKAAIESAARELETRPKKLYPYMGMLFGCLILQIAVALGLYMIEQYNIIM